MSAISEVKTVHDEGVRNMLLVSPALRATTVISDSECCSRVYQARRYQ